MHLGNGALRRIFEEDKGTGMGVESTASEESARQGPAVETRLSSREVLEEAAHILANALELPSPRGASERDALVLAARRAIEAPDLEGIRLRSNRWDSQEAELRELLTAGSEWSRLHQKYGPALKPHAWDQDLSEVRGTLAGKGRRWWRLLSSDYRQAQSQLADLAFGTLPSSLEARIELIDELTQAQRQRHTINELAYLGEELFGPRWQGQESDWDALSQVAHWVLGLHQDIVDRKLPDGVFDFLSENTRLDRLPSLVAEVEKAMHEHADAAGVIRDRLEASRRELLDLGLRNPLLNYRPLRSRGLEVVDELPPEVYRLLVEEGRTMSFLPVPEEGEGSPLGQPTDDEEPGSPAARHTDTRLQTELTSQELQARLLSTFRLANSFVQEQGVNTLFLALGMLTWYESDRSQDGHRAPLVLVPVTLDRSSVRHRFQLNHTGEDPGENLSLIEKARTEFGLDLPGLPEEEDLDLERYFGLVEESVKELPNWAVDRNSVVLGFFSFSKFLMYRDLDVNHWPDDAKPTEHPIIDALLHDGFREPSPTISEDEHLDERLPPRDVHHVVDADGSQTLAIVDVNSNRNLVVQGPPGTGKSQTITNMIAEAIGRSKTVLFVSEKMAALEVVKRRLNNVGLGDACLELHSHKTAKRAVLDELKRTLELGRPRVGQIQADFDTLAQLRQRLNSYCDAVNTPVGASGVTPFQAYGELTMLRREDAADTLPKLELPGIETWTDADFRRKEALVQELQARLSAMEIPQEHAFWGSRLKVLLPTEQDALRQAVQAAQQALSALVTVSDGLADALRVPHAASQTETQGLCLAARLATAAPVLRGTDIRSSGWLALGTELDELLSAGAEQDQLHREYRQVLVPSAWGEELQDLREVLANLGPKWWRLLSGNYRRAKTRLAQLCQSGLPSGLAAQLRLVDAVLESQDRRQIVNQHETLAARLFGSQWQGHHSDWAALSGLADWLRELHDSIDAGQIPKELIDFIEDNPSTDGLLERVSSVEAAVRDHKGTCSEVVNVLDLEEAKRFGADQRLEQQPFAIQEETLDVWLNNTSDIQDVVTFNNMVDPCLGEELGPVLEVAETWGQAGIHLADAFRQAWFENVLERALSQRDALSSFDGVGHQQIVQRFRDLDTLVLRHNQTRLAHAHWDRLPRQEGGGQLGVLRRQFELRRRHLPIRRLLERAGNAVQAIKPVFMMSPLSIATYIAPGSLKFDLVIFDEASQVKPVDAFGAIFRANQAVVVGDSQQLPPTNFFDATGQGSEDDEDSMTADIESILGLFAAQNAPSCMLRWHYRSRHESLIAVSNREFYGNSLVVFPSPEAARLDVGLRYRYLPGTVYDRGRSSTNQLEAHAVAEAVLDHARTNPDLTLGVAAFSSGQMRAVLDQLEMLRRQDPSCESFFTAHPHEPFFVKNLETVQGDERDVIFISIGYGRDGEGRLDMNFGPLNRDGGERRLNVLITRAKQRCEVFTNLTAEDIDLDRTGARGPAALKSFLSYARDGILDLPVQADVDTDSLFEQAVASALDGAGYDVRPQVGSVGHFIDLAIADPDQPGRYLLGIECDGATYHSSRSARDRDRLRQQVLEDLGWRIHRIWSTDWFRNQPRELARVVEAIESAKSSQVTKDPASATVPSIKRDEAAPEEEHTPNVQEYQLERPEFSVQGREFFTIPAATLALSVAGVVDVESPVHLHEVVRRIGESAGVRRGPRFREAVAQALEQVLESGRVRREGDFLWRKDMAIPPLRDRSKLPPSSRKIELVAPEEIAVAVHRVAAGSYGIDPSDVPAAAGRLLGFGRVTAEMRSRIEPVIRQLVRDGKLIQQGEQLRIADP